MQNQRLLRRYTHEGIRPLVCNLQHDAIPVDDQSFDLVIMCETLEHLNFNPLPVLAEVNRVLSSHGILYLSLPNLVSLVNRVKLLWGQSIHNPITDFVFQLAEDNNMIVGIHWREYTGSEINELLQLCGFSIQRHYYFTHTRSHPLARLVYRFFNYLRPNQTVIAEKVSALRQPWACCLGKGCGA
jgi:SAM-dependent methyltransferase